MPARAKRHPRHCGYSDDDGDCSPPPRAAAPSPLPSRAGAPAPAPAPPRAPGSPPFAQQQFSAPPGCRVGADLTPQQIAAVTSCRRTKVIGVGGFGKVYSVDLPPLGRVALKVAAPGGERALAAEALHLARAAHPAIVRALGSCWAPGTSALALEQLPGGCLDGRIGPAAAATCSKSRRAPLGWRERLRVSYQVASALAYLHGSLRVVHCDVKPGNVLLDGSGNAVLIDLGVARPVAGDAAAAAATAGSATANAQPARGGARGAAPAASGAAAHLRALAAGVASGGVAQMHGWCGTRDYLDPLFEQLGQLCEKSDVYSLGVIMVQLLFDSDEPREARRVAQHAVKSGELHLPACLADWPRASALAFGTAALRCCNAGDRDARPAAAELAAALRQMLAHAGEPGLARLAPGGLRLAAAAPPAKPAPRAGSACAAASPSAKARVVCLHLQLTPGGAAEGVAVIQVPPPPLAAPAGAAPQAPQRVAVTGEWDEATGRVRLTAAPSALTAGASMALAGRRPVEFTGSYAAGKLEGSWTYKAGTAPAAQEGASFWLVAHRPAPPAEPAAALSAAEAAAAPLAEGLAAAAAISAGSGRGSRRCSRNALVETSAGLVRAV